ncbi:MAG: glycosyl hydrolase 53 family protein [Rhodothermales bacterium]|nr:glycosyl hydrolase 53 family protein [Rhodothermales bacterium]MBO6780600.1 glycosyl hydrolase 53 family protein [Rhodothermales bacterium]
MRSVRKSLGLLAVGMLVLATSATAQLPEHVVGADVSFLTRVEEGGASFSAMGSGVDPIAQMVSEGFNTFRLRLWHTPAGGTNGLAYTTALAQRIVGAGGSWLLDIHYSDSWADPGTQTPPAAWAGLDVETMADSVLAYTNRVLRHLSASGVSPAAVQIGNEITSGMLWDVARVGGSFDTPASWARLAEVLRHAHSAVREVLPDVPVIVHIDRGGDAAGTQWFMDNLTAAGYTPDMLGLSYYPWWHGSLQDLRDTLQRVSSRYGVPAIVLETAYPWTFSWYDNTHNLVGSGASLPDGYPATPAGQRDFLVALDETVALQSGRGWIYWAPEWIAAPGFGSSWENLALFDEDGAWHHAERLTGVEATPGQPAWSVYPNPSAGLPQSTCPEHLEVFDLQGRPVSSVALAAGVYVARCGNLPRKLFVVQ